MKIISLSFEDLRTTWKLEHLSFKDMTLLVGTSGVGKTKILKALDTLKSIALGESLSPIKWELEFETNNRRLIWKGNIPENKIIFNFSKSIFAKEKTNNVDQYESLIEIKKDQNTLLFERKGNIIKFQDILVPKLTSDKSCIDLFSNEDQMKQIIHCFKRVFFFEFEAERQFGLNEIILENGNNDSNEAKALRILKMLDIPILVKLATTYKYFNNVFEEIKEEFIDVFPLVEDIRFKTVKNINEDGDEFKEYDLEIKENNGIWISRTDISSGMLKTLFYISMLHLVPKDSVLIIDEFENSLGINCIDILSDSVVSNSKQFIITSHHPYIINNISMNKWKIVSRKGNVVIGKDSAEYNLGKSKHDAFKQLINLKVYSEGSEF